MSNSEKNINTQKNNKIQNEMISQNEILHIKYVYEQLRKNKSTQDKLLSDIKKELDISSLEVHNMIEAIKKSSNMKENFNEKEVLDYYVKIKESRKVVLLPIYSMKKAW